MTPPKEQIPSKSAVIPFYVIAALSFLLVSVMCLIAAPSFIGHFFQPKLLAITHLAVLGWATMIIFGASNQLMPVITEQRLSNEKLPILILFLLTFGTGFLVQSFWQFSFTWLTYTGGIFILSAITLHAINIYNTVKRTNEHVINQLVITAHAWLLITAVIGFMMLVHLRFPFLSGEHLQYLKVHAGIGMGGWLLQLVIGISSKLVPMFLLSRKEETKWLQVTYYATNASLVFFMINGMLLHSDFIEIISQVILLTGLLYYARYIWGCYKTAMRKKMDNGMKQTFVALLLLSLPFLLLAIIGVLENGLQPNLVVAYGFSFVGGFISTIIMGQTFKTLPFIVWMHITRQDKLPELMPKDLYHENWVKVQMLMYLPGFLLFLSGILLKQLFLLYAGAGLMTVAAALYFVHVLLVIKTLQRDA